MHGPCQERDSSIRERMNSAFLEDGATAGLCRRDFNFNQQRTARLATGIMPHTINHNGFRRPPKEFKPRLNNY